MTPATLDLLAATWHWIDEARPEPIVPATLLPGSLDEPLLFTRDAAGVERCLSNVCTHRAALLVDAPCTARRIRCPYHGRAFALDGACQGQPRFSGARGDLPPAGWGRLGPARFASLGAIPFERFRAAFDARLQPYPIDALQPDPAAHRDFEVAAAWTLYVENYLEGLHVPFVHPGLDAALDPRRYAVERLPGAVLQIGEARADEPHLALPPGHPDAGRRIYAYYLWLFPTTMLNVYPWGISLNAVQPLGADRTRIRFRTYVRPGHARPPGFLEALHQTEREDERIVEAVQRGHRARLARPGALAPRHEDGVAWFRALLAEARAPSSG